MTSSHLHLTVGAILLSISCVAMAENAVTTEPASLRAGPDDSYPEVAQLDADSPIQVEGCLDDWSWCDVSVDGTRGWMYSPDITYEYQGGYVPFYTYAPAFSVPVVAFTVDAYWGRYYHDRPWFRDRDQWAHREVQHRPPPGPRPHSAPPPREAVVMDRPHGGRPGDHSIRLGNANGPRPPEHAPPPSAAHGAPPHDDHRDDHRDDRHAPDHADADHRGPDQGVADHAAADHAAVDHRADRPGPGSAAPERAAPDHPAPQHSAPPPHPAPEHAAQEHPAPHPAPQHDAHSAASHAEPQHREEPPRGEKPN